MTAHRITAILLTVALAIGVGLADVQHAGAVTKGAIGTPISNPEYVNIFWDQQWDKHSPTLTMAEIDNLTEALVNSTYLSTLGGYGVMHATFNSQAFIADPSCGNNGNAPSNVGVWAIFVGPTLTSFIDCESKLPGMPNAGNVIYNVFLPQSVTSCPGPGPGGHFQTSGHAFTYIDTNPGPACLNLSRDLDRVFPVVSHEMVEAATDPFTPWPHLFPKEEIVDVCDVVGFGPTDFLKDFQAGTSTGSAVSQYQNPSEVCVPGFTDTTKPSITSVQFTFSPNTQPPGIIVTGAGFGRLPALTTFAGGGTGGVDGQPVSGPPFTTNVPYFAIDDTSAGWQAGNSVDDNGITLKYQSWLADEIDISGFAGAYGNPYKLSAGDQIVVIVCNPASGNCVSSPSITYNPGVRIIRIPSAGKILRPHHPL